MERCHCVQTLLDNHILNPADVVGKLLPFLRGSADSNVR
jgi:hypothetical protein